ncbi:hypothetical protein Tco_0441628 [Tanacetum coccineum]
MKSVETIEIGQKRSKSVEKGQNWSKSVENGGNRSKSIENGRKRSKSVKNGRNRSNTVEIGRKQWKMVKIGGKRSKTVEIGRNQSNTVKLIENGANPVRVMASGAIDINHKMKSMIPRYCALLYFASAVPHIINNTYVIIEFKNGARGMLDLFMFAEGSKNEQEIYVIGKTGKVEAFVPENIVCYGLHIEGRDGVKAGARLTPVVDLQDGLTAVAIGVAAQLSIEKGTFVSINEVMS